MEGSPAVDLLPLFRDPRIADELHALLWTNPYLNEGTVDLGWSCRDHAVVMGALLLRRGVDVAVRQGTCAFVQGPTSDGLPAVAIEQGTDPVWSGAPAAHLGDSRLLGHTWLYVPSFGDIDLSPNLEFVSNFDDVDLSPSAELGIATWRPVSGIGVLASRWIADRPAEWTRVTASDYRTEIVKASRITDAAQAVYCCVAEEPFDLDMARAGLRWADSRVSLHLLDGGYADDLYLRLSRHLDGLATGVRSPFIGTVDTVGEAWEAIARDSG